MTFASLQTAFGLLPTIIGLDSKKLSAQQIYTISNADTVDITYLRSLWTNNTIDFSQLTSAGTVWTYVQADADRASLLTNLRIQFPTKSDAELARLILSSIKKTDGSIVHISELVSLFGITVPNLKSGTAALTLADFLGENPVRLTIDQLINTYDFAPNDIKQAFINKSVSTFNFVDLTSNGTDFRLVSINDINLLSNLKTQLQLYSELSGVTDTDRDIAIIQWLYQDQQIKMINDISTDDKRNITLLDIDRMFGNTEAVDAISTSYMRQAFNISLFVDEVLATPQQMTPVDFKLYWSLSNVLIELDKVGTQLTQENLVNQFNYTIDDFSFDPAHLRQLISTFGLKTTVSGLTNPTTQQIYAALTGDESYKIAQIRTLFYDDNAVPLVAPIISFSQLTTIGTEWKYVYWSDKDLKLNIQILKQMNIERELAYYISQNIKKMDGSVLHINDLLTTSQFTGGFTAPVLVLTFSVSRFLAEVPSNMTYTQLNTTYQISADKIVKEASCVALGSDLVVAGYQYSDIYNAFTTNNKFEQMVNGGSTSPKIPLTLVNGTIQLADYITQFKNMMYASSSITSVQTKLDQYKIDINNCSAANKSALSADVINTIKVIVYLYNNTVYFSTLGGDTFQSKLLIVNTLLSNLAGVDIVLRLTIMRNLFDIYDIRVSNLFSMDTLVQVYDLNAIMQEYSFKDIYYYITDLSELFDIKSVGVADGITTFPERVCSVANILKGADGKWGLTEKLLEVSHDRHDCYSHSTYIVDPNLDCPTFDVIINALMKANAKNQQYAFIIGNKTYNTALFEIAAAFKISAYNLVTPPSVDQQIAICEAQNLTIQVAQQIFPINVISKVSIYTKAIKRSVLFDDKLSNAIKALPLKECISLKFSISQYHDSHVNFNGITLLRAIETFKSYDSNYVLKDINTRLLWRNSTNPDRNRSKICELFGVEDPFTSDPTDEY